MRIESDCDCPFELKQLKMHFCVLTQQATLTREFLNNDQMRMFYLVLITII